MKVTSRPRNAVRYNPKEHTPQPLSEHTKKQINIESYRTDGTEFSLGMAFDGRVFVFDLDRVEAERLRASLADALKDTKPKKRAR